jgi:ABC-type multidrug transport system ATPase subunit
MQISLSDCGKRFNRDWIFRKVSFEFNSSGTYAITGPNGSGKSTLLQCIAGAVSLSEGTIKYKGIQSDDAFRQLSIAAPYQELIEEMTLIEFLSFHNKFKPFISSIKIPEIISIINLEKASNKQIRYFSSGMKQRVKLAQAIFSDVPCILLDEPCTNLDIDGINLYQRLINNYCHNRMVIVSSNDIQEYGFCKEAINILDYKISL